MDGDCPICGPVTCGCTPREKDQYEEIQRLRLTDTEREAVKRAIDCFDGIEDVSADAGARDASARCSLRGLLERLS